MMRVRWVNPLLFAGLVAVPLPGQVPTVEPEDEIVVIARKLRKVRIDYATRGAWVTKCDAEISSDDPRIDRIMCAIVKACVREGNREVKETQACVAGRIDQLAEGAPAPVAVAAAPPPDVAPLPKIPSPSAGSGQSDIVVRGSLPDIIVIGNVPSLRDGLWQFHRGATLTFGGGGGGRPARFTQCLPDGTIEAMLRRAAGEGNMLSALITQTHCGRLRTKMADGRIDASRSCVNARSERQLTMTGRYDKRQLTLNYSVEQEHNGLERGGGAGWNPARPVGYRWQVTATRIGECPIKQRRDELDANDAILALFSE
ncbi:hypothetical protein ACFQ15_09310 [Sphingomonas hankookensis]|uniref:hypothetical protein n=1 Tax=Sphingomonas hankookensis TaxID=563996 RepID=UPI001F57C2F2|nr:hypothetical protein [Sphingomonas hankookensis]